MRGVLAVAALLVLAVGVVLGLFRLAGSPERGWDLSGIWRASGL